MTITYKILSLNGKSVIFNILYGFPIQLCTSLNSNFTGKRSGISVNPIIADGASEDYCSLCFLIDFFNFQGRG